MNDTSSGIGNNSLIIEHKDELSRIEFKFDEISSFNQLSEMGLKNGVKFIDIGCGGGAMTRLVKKKFPEMEVTGIDISPDRIQFANDQAREQKLDICYKCTNVTSLPFKDNSFDFVWSRFLFEYLKQPIAALKEMLRVAKNTGVVSVGDLDGNCLFHYPVTEDFNRKLNRVISTLAEFGFDPFVGRKLYYYFRQAGFKKITTKIFTHHNIAGKPDEQLLKNWQMKIDSISKLLEKSDLNKEGFVADFKREFISYIKNPETFTYSPLIFVRGEI